jgi:DNA invertase Pin-like site-specific DNA recombinase
MRDDCLVHRPRAAIYVRVSTAEQSVENQLPELQRLAEVRGLEVVEVFSENVSATRSRPEFERMLSDAHRGRFCVLLVWSLDRLHRSMLGAMQTVLDLDRWGVEVISLREPWLDMAGPVRSLLIAIFGWVAEQERLRISERTKAGLAAARRRGSRIGRPRVRLDLDRAQELRAGGASLRDVARELGVGPATLHRALTMAASA